MMTTNKEETKEYAIDIDGTKHEVVPRNLQYEQEIWKICLDILAKPRKKNEKRNVLSIFIHSHKELYDYILERTPLLSDNKKYAFQTRIVWTLNGLLSFPQCEKETCRKPLVGKNTGISTDMRYAHYCGGQCATSCKEVLEKRKQTNLKRLGTEWPGQSQKVKDKAIETYRKHYGTDHYFQSQAFKETVIPQWIEKYGVDNPWKAEEVKTTIKETNLKRYSVESYAKTEEFKIKSKKTKLERYGNENYVNPEKAAKTIEEKQKDNPDYYNEINQKKLQTNLKRYGDEHYRNIEKSKKTKFENHGDEFYNNMEKNYQTKLERYGDATYNNRPKMKETVKMSVENDPMYYEKIKEKTKETNLVKYGTEFYTQTDEYKEKARQTCLEKYGCEFPTQSDEIKEKARQTSIEKYGVNNWTKTSLFKDRYLDKEFVASIMKKQYLTKKKRNSFHISKEEEKCFSLLKEAFPNIIRQYRSEAYPFNCDFYIPEKDLYIEFNGMWTHGGHAFDPNNEEDVKLVETWCAKNTKFYHGAINVWTQRDVKKRETAKKNNLNFIEFWNLDEVKAWLSTFSIENKQ